jgi:hypothetical protein
MFSLIFANSVLSYLRKLCSLLIFANSALSPSMWRVELAFPMGEDGLDLNKTTAKKLQAFLYMPIRVCLLNLAKNIYKV